jgi:bifunctional UDP-N-acetylglucosamine pyrophosphorylase/glucosamine-1-phosphate N-acetyltransferase
MQAVILAAGKSTRTFPLTVTRPKPLLLLQNKTLLEHKLDSLKGVVNEIIIIIGYKGDMIRKSIGKNYHGIKITYVVQKEQKGTGHALLLAKKRIKGKFIMMMGDDWYSMKDIRACIRHPYSILVSKVDHPEHFGVVKENKANLSDIIEKPSNPPSNLINTGLYVIDKSIFPLLEGLKVSERGDIEFPAALVELSKFNNVKCVLASQYFSIGYPWDLLIADQKIRKGKNAIMESSTITGKIKNSSIGKNCIIKGVVKNSIIMDGCVIGKGSNISHSVLGFGVKFNGNINSAKAVSSVNGKLVDCKVFGAAIGDNVDASNVSILPGVKIWPKKRIKGEINEDVT